MTSTFTKAQMRALGLLARGGARYGTQIVAMRQLQAMGLCRAHDTGKGGKGRWTWRPTPEGWRVIREMEAESC